MRDDVVNLVNARAHVKPATVLQRRQVKHSALAHGLTAYGHTNMDMGQSTTLTTGAVGRSERAVNPSRLAQLLGSQLSKAAFQNDEIGASKPTVTLPCAKERPSLVKGTSPSLQARSCPPAQHPRPGLPRAACRAGGEDSVGQEE